MSNTSWTSTWCPLADLLGAQIQTDDARAAYDVFRERRQIAPSVCPDYPEGAGGPARRHRGIRRGRRGADAGRGEPPEPVRRGRERGALGDLGRRAGLLALVGDWDQAGRVLDEWRADLPDDPWPEHRAGEVAFLRGDFDHAVADYREADDAFRTVKSGSFGEHGYGDSYIGEEEGSADNQLELGAALEWAGHIAEARRAYGQARNQADGQELGTASTVDFDVHSQLGWPGPRAGRL